MGKKNSRLEKRKENSFARPVALYFISCLLVVQLYVAYIGDKT